MVTKIPMLMRINAQNTVRIILKMGLSGWSALYVKNGFMRHAFLFRIFVYFLFDFFVGRKMQAHCTKK